jgi:hypothetical protein
MKTLCAAMGEAKIAHVLCRAGLHLSTTTVGRMLAEDPEPVSLQSGDAKSDGRAVTAKRPNHGSHGCAHRSRLLVQLATICLTPALALLLVSGRRSGSLLQTRHGHHNIQSGTERSCCSRVSRASHRGQWSQAEASHLRQRLAVLALHGFLRTGVIDGTSSLVSVRSVSTAVS